MPIRPFLKPFALFAAVYVCLVAPTRGDEKRIATADLVHATLVADVDAAAPGSAFNLGVRLKIAPHYHTYWVNPGEFGNPTRIKLTGPAGFEFGEIQWPLPTRIEHDGSVTFGYEDDVLLMVPVKVATSVPVGGAATIRADVSWLSCSDACVEGAAKLEMTLPISLGAKPANVELFESWKKRLPVAKDPAVVSAVQSRAADGSPAPALVIQWNVAPAKIEWLPMATPAVAIDDVVVKQVGQETQISFKPTIYKPDQIPGGAIGSVLVYQDAKGLRHGITVPIELKIAHNGK